MEWPGFEGVVEWPVHRLVLKVMFRQCHCWWRKDEFSKQPLAIPGLKIDLKSPQMLQAP